MLSIENINFQAITIKKGGHEIFKNSRVTTFLVGILIMTITLCCSSLVQAAPGDFTYTVTGGAAQITGYTGAGGVVTIPSTLVGTPVTSIGDYAFFACPSLTSISIPQGVISIGNAAFGDCPGLTSISNSQGVTSIGNAAFIGCSGLTGITISQGVIIIGQAAFTNCTGLNTITFNSATTIIYDEAGTIPATTKIIGYDSSAAEGYATKYNRTFALNSTPAVLQSLAIASPATNLSYNIGDSLDITGLVVTGTYSDGSTQAVPIAASNVTGFNSAVAATDQVLTITISGQTVTYNVQIVAAATSTGTAPSIIIYQDANGNYVSVNYLSALSNTSMKQSLINALSAAELANLPIYVTADNGQTINYLAAINKSENYAKALNDSAVAISAAPMPTEQINADGSVTSL